MFEMKNITYRISLINSAVIPVFSDLMKLLPDSTRKLMAAFFVSSCCGGIVSLFVIKTSLGLPI